MDPRKIDRDEDKRVAKMRKDARSRQHFKLSKDSTKRSVSIRLPRAVMGYSSPAALGYAIQKQIMLREYAMAQREVGVVQHVKDGKPLTEKGAQMLGVSWVPTEVKEKQ